MSKTQLERSFQPFKMTLESATFDWRSPRVQLGLGLALLLIPFALVVQEFFATRFFMSEFLALGTSAAGTGLNPLLELAGQSLTLSEVWLLGHHSWEYRVTTFVLFVLTAAMAGLISYEATFKYGSRSGASQGIFASLLFLSIPIGNPLILPSTMTAPIVSNLLALGAVLMDMRFRRLREREYYWSALALLLIAGALDLRGLVVGTCGILMARCFIPPGNSAFRGGLQSYAGATPYLLFLLATVLAPLVAPSSEPYLTQLQSVIKSFIQPFKVLSADTETIPKLFKFVTKAQPILAGTAFGVLGGRLLFASVWLSPFVFSFLWLVSSVVILCLVPLPGDTVWNQLHSTDGIHAIFLFFTVPFSIMFTLAALPCSDYMKKPFRMAVTAIGAIILSCIFVSWSVILLHEVHQRYTNARELSFFRLELGKKLEESEGRLMVVNPPLLDEGSELSLTERTSKGGREQLLSDASKFYEALLDSPLIRDKAEIDIHPSYRRGLVELSKRSKTQLKNQVETYVWSKESRQLEPIYYSGKKSLQLTVSKDSLNNFTFEPANVVKVDSQSWNHIDNGLPYVEMAANGVRLAPGTTGDITLWFPTEIIDPSKISSIQLKGTVLSEAEDDSEDPPAWLVFTGEDTPNVIDQLAIPFTGSKDVLIAATRGQSDWLKHRSINRIGIKLPVGSAGLFLNSIETTANRE